MSAAGDLAGSGVVHVTDVDGAPRTVVTQPGTGRSTVIPGDAPLVAAATWVTMTDVGVIGARCNKWQGGAPPKWSDDSQANVPDLCGTSDYEVWLVDRSSGKARGVAFSGLDAGNGYSVIGAGGNSVLVMGMGLHAGLTELHLDTGVDERLPDYPSLGGSAEANFTPCLDAQGSPFGVLAWSGATPPAVAAAGWDDHTVRAADKTAISVVTPKGDTGWTAIDVKGDLTAFAGVSGCGPSGAWTVGRNGGGVVEVDNGSAMVSSIPSPAPGTGVESELNVHRLLGGGPPVAAVQVPPGPGSPDAPREATCSLWHDTAWEKLPCVDLGLTSTPFLNGARIASLNERIGGHRLVADLS